MSKIIKFFDPQKELIDSVNAEYEDSFCLETFSDLINSFEELGKSFIIARVQTCDPKQPEKAFYSYYNAYQLNKVLFQTQVYLGKKFIHRLHVLNPLSNLDIVGEVLYFVVSKKQAEKIKEETPVQQAFPVTSGDNTKNQFLIKKLSINTAVEKDIVDTLPQASPTVKDMDANSLARWTMGGPIASPMSDPVDIQPLSAVEMTLPDRDSGILDLKDGASHPWLPTATKSKRIQLNPGALTRYTVPLTAKEVDVVKPHTKRRNQRAWSFMNSINQMGPSLSLEEWRKLAKSHSAVKGGSPVSYDSIDSSITLQAGNTLEANSTESVYEAHLYCTDNDFLEQSKIRLYFKGNALNEEESKLFEMPPVVSLNPAEAANNNDLVTTHQSGVCCQYCATKDNPVLSALFRARLFIVMLLFGVIIVVSVHFATRRK